MTKRSWQRRLRTSPRVSLLSWTLTRLFCKYRVQLSSHYEPSSPKQSTWAMQASVCVLVRLGRSKGSFTVYFSAFNSCVLSLREWKKRKHIWENIWFDDSAARPTSPPRVSEEILQERSKCLRLNSTDSCKEEVCCNTHTVVPSTPPHVTSTPTLAVTDRPVALTHADVIRRFSRYWQSLWELPHGHVDQVSTSPVSRSGCSKARLHAVSLCLCLNSGSARLEVPILRSLTSLSVTSHWTSKHTRNATLKRKLVFANFECTSRVDFAYL